MPEITATVVAKSASGVMLKENGPWFNWSHPEYRGTPFNTEVQKGDKVQITYAEKEYTDKETGEPFTKYFVSTIDKVTGPKAAGITPVASDPPEKPDEPFPPDEDFPPDEPQSPPAPSEDYGQSLWAKDRLKARTDCIACAVGIFKSSIELGLLKEMPSPEKVVAYAATLELWAKSE